MNVVLFVITKWSNWGTTESNKYICKIKNFNEYSPYEMCVVLYLLLINLLLGLLMVIPISSLSVVTTMKLNTLITTCFSRFWKKEKQKYIPMNSLATYKCYKNYNFGFVFISMVKYLNSNLNTLFLCSISVLITL